MKSKQTGYDEWKTTNPADEELRPEPPEEIDDLGFRKIIDKKDAEIARLKEELDLERHISGSADACIGELRKYRTDLANAAALYLSLDGSDKIYDAVKLQGARVKLREEIQRAKEATQ